MRNKCMYEFLLDIIRTGQRAVEEKKEISRNFNTDQDKFMENCCGWKRQTLPDGGIPQSHQCDSYKACPFLWCN
jgi:hypothetical protein